MSSHVAKRKVCLAPLCKGAVHQALGYRQPLGGELPAANVGRAMQPRGQRGEAGDLCSQPSACLQGCKCFACLPRHADTVTVR